MSMYFIFLGSVLVLIPLIFVIMLIANKMVYGKWLMFPWSYHNPCNVRLREINAEIRRLKMELVHDEQGIQRNGQEAG